MKARSVLECGSPLPLSFRVRCGLALVSAIGWLVLPACGATRTWNGQDGAAPFRVPGGPNCNSSSGGCESCIVVSGQFATNAPTTAQPLYFVGAPSVCLPSKPCPGVDPSTNLPPLRYLTHSFSNSTTKEVCVIAQVKFDCPMAPTNALGLAAYLNGFDPNLPCAGYLGDSGVGADQLGYPPFSFRVPAGSNFVIVVSARATNLMCDTYALELFGASCPPPHLDIASDATPGKVLVSWSSAYPDFHLQSVDAMVGATPFPFTNFAVVPALVGGKYMTTNATTGGQKFYRLFKP